MTKIMFVGDPHSEYYNIHGEIAQVWPDVVVLLGDMDLERPIDEEFAYELDNDIRVLFIPGNHDYDREHWYDNLILAERCENIHGRVIDIDGVRIGGLGGNFQGKIWHPQNGDGNPIFKTRERFMFSIGPQRKWRKGLPIRVRGAIWYEDYEKLADTGANILVTHEAPSCHQYGYEVLDDLAEIMDARMIIHGHHHHGYDDTVGDISVTGIDKAVCRVLTINHDNQMEWVGDKRSCCRTNIRTATS